jgi:hypothetical protein
MVTPRVREIELELTLYLPGPGVSKLAYMLLSPLEVLTPDFLEFKEYFAA